MTRVFVALAVLAALQQASQTPPVFHSATHLRVETVRVNDKQGKPVQGLTATDFIVTEDGQRQQIAFVEYQSLDRPPAPSTQPPAADVLGVPSVTNVPVPIPPDADARYRGRRLLVLYFDLYNMPFFDELRMYESAGKYISSDMAPADLVAIMAFQNGQVTLKQAFTDDREALRNVIQQLVTAADDALNNAGVEIETSGAFGEDDDTFNLFSTDRQLAALQTAVTDLAPLPEVKTLVYFGSGLHANGANNQAQIRATVNAAVRANVTINPIDTRGLSAEPPLGDATRASPGGIGMFNGSLAQTALAQQQQSQDTYYSLAKDTGGRAMFDYNDLSVGIVQAAQAVTGYYLIGYYVSKDVKDGRFRRLKVELRAGLSGTLAYRAGYYAPKEYAKFNATEKERQLEDALRTADPITDIPMAMEVNYFQLNGSEYFVPVSVRIPGSELTRPRANASTTDIVDMIGEIKDDYGVTIRNAKDQLKFTLDPARAAEVARRPIQYETGFTLLPGNYVIKVLARDAETGRIGTFQTPFTVPNLDREHTRLPISSIVLSTERAARSDALFNVKEKVSSDVGNPLVANGRKLIPSVTRTFRSNQPLLVFLQAYERDTPSMQPLVAYAAFYRDGIKVFETEPVGVPDGRVAASGGIPIQLNISLAQLTPGAYDCQVTVLDPAGNRAAFWRTALTIVR